MNAGLVAAKKRGVKLSRPATLDAHRDNITRLRAQGRTGRAIAAELSLPVGSVFQVLREFRLAASLISAVPYPRNQEKRLQGP